MLRINVFLKYLSTGRYCVAKGDWDVGSTIDVMAADEDIDNHSTVFLGG
jgi:hypothetical protein